MLKKKIIIGVSVLSLTLLPQCATYAQSFYNGNVQKYSDFESGNSYKTSTSTQAANDVVTKPSGSFQSWTEIGNSGTYGGVVYTEGLNATEKTEYTTIGYKYMTYVKNFDADSSIAYAINTNKVPTKLNISTSLSNFTGGGVSGFWAPDPF